MDGLVVMRPPWVASSCSCGRVPPPRDATLCAPAVQLEGPLRLVRADRVPGAGPVPPSARSQRKSNATLMAPLFFLISENGEGVPPLVESEGVGEHPGQIDPALFHQLQIVGDPVHPHATDLLHAEGVRSHPRDLLEVQR